MTVSIELFLVDNMMMNLLVLRLGAALAGKRLRSYIALPASLIGALYALLTMTAARWLMTPLPKLAFGALMALLLMNGRRGYLKGLLSLYLSAFLLGGVMLALSMLFGGEVAGGALMGTVPIRVVLLSVACFLALPRLGRYLINACRNRVRHVRLSIELEDRIFSVWALVDSGNLLTEPISGLPVIVLRPGLLPQKGVRPVPYAVMGGEGTLFALRPRRVCAKLSEWMELDAYVAEASGMLGAEEAIIGSNLVNEERRMWIDQETDDAAWETIPEDPAPAGEGAPVSPLGRNAANAVSGGGGSDVDRKAHAGR